MLDTRRGAARGCPVLPRQGHLRARVRIRGARVEIPYPKDALFIQDWIYQYGLLDELAINAYWTGKYQECADACDRLLTEGKLPTDKRVRVQKNKDFAVGSCKKWRPHPPRRLDLSSSSFVLLGRRSNLGVLTMRLFPPTWRQPRHVRHALRPYMVRPATVVTKACTNEDMSSPHRA